MFLSLISIQTSWGKSKSRTFKMHDQLLVPLLHEVKNLGARAKNIPHSKILLILAGEYTADKKHCDSSEYIGYRE